MVAYQRLERLRGLVIGGMRFKDGVRKVVGDRRECGGAFGAVVFDAVMVKFDAGLDDQRHDPRPDVIAEAVRGEGVFMYGVGGARGVRRGRRDAIERFFRPAGHGYFGADDVNQRHGAGHSGARVFGDAAEAGGTFGDSRVWQRHRITGAAHAAIEVDFFVTGLDVMADEFLAVGHRLVCGQVLPAVRAEVVAAEDGVGVGGQQFFDLGDELRRRHAGVAAELIDLVRGGFEQQRRAVFTRQFCGSADDGGVRAAYGNNAAAPVSFVCGDDGRNAIFHRRLPR